VQSQRKTLDLEFTDRIELGLVTESADLRAALEAHTSTIAGETLATVVSLEPLAKAAIETLNIDGHSLTIHLRRAADES
jgi:isoleucyl-tRNA synthetase